MTHTTQTDYDALIAALSVAPRRGWLPPAALFAPLESEVVAIRDGLDDTHRALLDDGLAETDREFAAIRQRSEEMIAQMFRKR